MLRRDFSDASILDDFEDSLERTLRGQLTDSGLYMGIFFFHCIPVVVHYKVIQGQVCGYCQTSICDILWD